MAQHECSAVLKLKASVTPSLLLAMVKIPRQTCNTGAKAAYFIGLDAKLMKAKTSPEVKWDQVVASLIHDHFSWNY